MTRIVLSCSIAIILTFSGCKKETNSSLNNQLKNPFFDSAIQFLRTKLTDVNYAQLDIASNKILSYQNRNIGLQIFEKGLPPEKFLILGKESGNYFGNWVDLSGLNSSGTKYQKGFIVLESFNKETKTTLIIDSNEVTQIIKTGNNIPGSVSIDPHNKNFLSDKPFGGNKVFRNEVNGEVLPPVVVTCYTCSPVDDYSSLYWILDGYRPYGYLYFPPGGGEMAALPPGPRVREIKAVVYQLHLL